MATLFGIVDNASHLYHAILRPRRQKNDIEILYEEIEKARSDIERAEALFNEATNSSISDYAAYNMLAHKARYSYLISLAKEKSIRS